MKQRRTAWLTALALAATMAGVAPHGTQNGLIEPRMAEAQNFGERTVSGTVLDAASDPVSGATVFLRNQKTKTIRSFASLQNGHFFFAQVSKDQDFDLWAEKNGKKSAMKTVSSWDDRNDWISDLKLK